LFPYLGDTERLGVFESRILRAIYGPTKEGHEWRIRNNRELYDLQKVHPAGTAEMGRTYH
jgi:hypothetical protein